MEKAKILIVGSGWRSLYYVRIIKALSQYFELAAMLCRTEEKADHMTKTYDIVTSLSVEECEAMRPDLVVVAVDKAHIAETVTHWAKKGFTVLGETPAGMDVETLKNLWDLHVSGHKIFFAEQYHLYPANIARLKILKEGYIGEAHYLYLSLAHEYHGISLMRRFLNIGNDVSFTVRARQFCFPTRETYDRYHHFTDPLISLKKRTLALFEFENGKICAYDFDSEQYRSPIRHDSYKIQGAKGELCNDEVSFLDENNDVHTSKMNVLSHIVDTGDENPNLTGYEEIESITFDDKTVYEASFKNAGLSQDETAIALLLWQIFSGKEPYPLQDALQDAYMAILLREAVEEDRTIRSETLPWQY